MTLLKRRHFAAFFLSLLILLSSADHSLAALAPNGAPHNSNVNSQSVLPERQAQPVELNRGSELPDISDIFEGYSVDELPTDIPASTSATPHFSVDDDTLLILELYVGNELVDDALLGYSKEGTLLLPLGALTERLLFPIRIDTSTRQAEGWFTNEAQSFKLDIRRSIATIAGKVESYNSERIEIRDDDIYVDAELLSRWMSLEFDFSFAEQVVTITAKDGIILPIERLAKLEIAREELRLRPTDPSANFPTIRAPYTLGTLPFTDITITSDYDEQINPRSRTQGSILSHGDLLYFNQSSFISYNEENGLEDVRLTLSRRDPNGQLFYGDDPLSNTWLAQKANDVRLTNLEIGDVFTPQLPLTTLNQNGRGVVISNQPLNRAEQFDRTSISGDVPPDWEVELYRNEELLAFQRSTTTGRYEFNDVPLLSGLNIFRLVFYGPFGETREEIRRILVDQTITKKGQSYFRLIALDQGERLVDVTDGSSTSFTSSFFAGTNNTASLNTQGEERVTLEYEYGLADQLALYLQAARVPVDSETTTHVATIGLAKVWEEIYGRIDIARNDDNGTAVQLLTQTNLHGVNLSLRHEIFNNFLSDLTDDPNDPVRNRTIIRADGSVKLPALPRLSFGLAGAYTKFDSERTRIELNQRTTATILGRAALNHNLTFSRDDTPGAGDPIEFTNGNVLLSVPAFGAFIRGGLNYSITPDTELQNVSITADYSLSPDTLIRGEVFREFSDRTDTYIGSLTHRFKHFSIGINSGITSEGDIIAGLAFNTAIGFEPRTGKLRSYGEPASRQGLISAQSYIDQNGNDIRDNGEEALGDISYLVNNGPGNSRSQDSMDDVQLVKNISTYEAVPISINPPSLENPFLVAGDSSINAVTRPGTPLIVDFAVRPAADIEGSVTLEKNGELVEAANVLIEALDGDGKVVRSTRTAFDGIYLLELLPLGEYTLRVSPEQAESRGFKTGEQLILTIDGSKEYIQELDFQISR